VGPVHSVVRRGRDPLTNSGSYISEQIRVVFFSDVPPRPVEVASNPGGAAPVDPYTLGDPEQSYYVEEEL